MNGVMWEEGGKNPSRLCREDLEAPRQPGAPGSRAPELGAQTPETPGPRAGRPRPARTSRSLRPSRSTSSIRVSRVSLESPLSSSSCSSRRLGASSSPLPPPPPAARSLSAALREASVRRCTRPELRWVSEVMAPAEAAAPGRQGRGTYRLFSLLLLLLPPRPRPRASVLNPDAAAASVGSRTGCTHGETGPGERAGGASARRNSGSFLPSFLPSCGRSPAGSPSSEAAAAPSQYGGAG